MLLILKCNVFLYCNVRTCVKLREIYRISIKIFISESEVSLIYYYLGLALSCAGITSMTDVCSLQNHHSQLWGNETQNIFGVRFQSDPDRMQISSAEYGEIEYNYHRSLRHENWIGKCSTDSKLDTKNSYDVTCNWFLFHSPTLSSILFHTVLVCFNLFIL